MEPVGFDPEGLAWEGTIEVVDLDCTVSTGCPATASASGGADPAGNALGAPASLTTEIDTVAPTAPVIGSFTAVLPAGESAPADTLNMFASDFSVTASIIAGEASPGIATVLLDDVPLDGAVDLTIGASDTSISASSSFGSAAALQEAIADDVPHTLAIELCDDAGNCSETATGLDVVADYTPAVEVTLTAPAGGGVIGGGSNLDIVWDGADDEGFDHVTLAYSTDGGQSFPTVIADGLTDRDGTFSWAVPRINAAQVVVRAALADVEGNRTYGPSDAFRIRSDALFADMPMGHKHRTWAEAMYDSGITTGCASSPLLYCPSREVSRAQMAVFLVRAMGEADDLPDYQGYFSDAPEGWSYTPYIEKFYELGITTGCGGNKFCSSRIVDRKQMAVFMVRALGFEDEVGEPEGRFADMSMTSTYTPYVERFYDLGITTGCGSQPLRYCPDRAVDRAGMAVFIVRAWDLPMLD